MNNSCEDCREKDSQIKKMREEIKNVREEMRRKDEERKAQDERRLAKIKELKELSKETDRGLAESRRMDREIARGIGAMLRVIK